MSVLYFRQNRGGDLAFQFWGIDAGAFISKINRLSIGPSLKLNLAGTCVKSKLTFRQTGRRLDLCAYHKCYCHGNKGRPHILHGSIESAINENPHSRPKHLRSICHTSRLIGDFVQILAEMQSSRPWPRIPSPWPRKVVLVFGLESNLK